MAVYRFPVHLNWTGPGSPGVNVWSIRTASDLPIETDLQAAVDAIHAFYAAIENHQGGGWSIIQNGTTITAGEAVERSSQAFAAVDWTQITCNSGNTDLPPSNQICVTWRTSIAARRGMGRTFIGPISEAAMDVDGSINDNALTTCRAAAQALVDASLLANDWAIGVWGYDTAVPQGQTQRTDFSRVHRDTTGFKIRDQFAVLRSRRD